MFARTRRLEGAYRATIYRVAGPGQGRVRHDRPHVSLQIGQRDPALVRLLSVCQARTAAVITAHNPLSRPRSRAANAAAQARLMAALAARGFHWRAAEGEDPAGQWPGEESVLVCGLSRGAAAALGRAFRQNAVVWLEAGRAPELLALF